MEIPEVFIVVQASGAILEFFSSRDLAENCVATYEAMIVGGLTIEHWNVETSPVAMPANTIRIIVGDISPKSA